MTTNDIIWVGVAGTLIVTWDWYRENRVECEGGPKWPPFWASASAFSKAWRDEQNLWIDVMALLSLLTVLPVVCAVRRVVGLFGSRYIKKRVGFIEGAMDKVLGTKYSSARVAFNAAAERENKKRKAAGLPCVPIIDPTKPKGVPLSAVAVQLPGGDLVKVEAHDTNGNPMALSDYPGGLDMHFVDACMHDTNGRRVANRQINHDPVTNIMTCLKCKIEIKGPHDCLKPFKLDGNFASGPLPTPFDRGQGLN